MQGVLYGVGVGPGDPKLLTLLAVETLQQVDRVIVPDMGGEKTALAIVAEYIKDKPKLLCHLPMTRDEAALAAAHEAAAALICKALAEGQNLAFITLGDPTVYSTYIYLHRLVLAKGFEAKIINGVPSFCAVAAKLNISLCDKAEALHIIPASYSNTQEMLALDGNKVLMKSGKQLGEVIAMLQEQDLIAHAKMVERCGMEGETIYQDLSQVTDSSYFSVVVVKEKDDGCQ